MTAPAHTPAYLAARGAYMHVRRMTSTLLLDRRMGIETSIPAPLSSLGVAGRDRVDYEPSGILLTRRMLDAHPIQPDDVFLDLGCGKGRVVLQAARRPFRRVVGVDVSPQLIDVAQRNLESCRSRLRCQDVEFVAADAASYEIPDDVTAVYMCNPFGGEIFQAAVDALLASVERRPRRLRLSYCMPLEHDRLMATGRFRLAGELTTWRPTAEWALRAGIREYDLLPGREVAP
jgi:SAM-dependent methyltransferase